MATLNCLGTVNIVQVKTPDVQLLASAQADTIQQSTVRLNCILERGTTQEITLPQVKSFNGAWSALELMVTDARGTTNETTVINVNAAEGDTIEGRPTVVVQGAFNSVILKVASYNGEDEKGVWNLL
jgi:hypothetical protein